MSLEELIGKYFRLQREISSAYGELPFLGARVDRLTRELASTDREIAALAPVDEQCSEQSFWISLTGPTPNTFAA